jgi:hypothetical protein
MYVCMYACMHAYACMYACMCVCVCVCMCVYGALSHHTGDTFDTHARMLARAHAASERVRTCDCSQHKPCMRVCCYMHENPQVHTRTCMSLHTQTPKTTGARPSTHGGARARGFSMVRRLSPCLHARTGSSAVRAGAPSHRGQRCSREGHPGAGSPDEHQGHRAENLRDHMMFVRIAGRRGLMCAHKPPRLTS